MAAGSCTPPGSLEADRPGYPKAILRAELEGKYLCSECGELLRRPFQAQCGHRYCAYCLKNLVSSGPQPCAACLREGLYEEGVSVLDSGSAFPDNAARREVEILPAACARKDCPWKGTIKEYEAHEESCPKAPLTCDGCGKTDILREMFAEHVESCGKCRVACRFRTVGCGEVVEKQGLALHEAQNLPEHLGLLLSFTLRLAAGGTPSETGDPHEFGIPHPVKDPSLVGLPRLTRDPLPVGVALPTGAPHLGKAPVPVGVAHPTGTPHLGKDRLPIGVANSTGDPDLGKDRLPIGVANSTRDPDLGKDRLPIGVANSTGDPDLVNDRLPIAAANSTGAGRPAGAPHPAQSPHPLGVPVGESHPAGGPGWGVPAGPRWEALEKKASTFEKIVCVLNREVERVSAAAEEAALDRRREQDRAEALAHKVRQLERSLVQKDAALEELQAALRCAEAATYDGVFVWKVGEVGRKRQEAMAGREPAIFSPAFYTSRYGYKMCLRLYLNGDGTGRGTHLSLFFVLMKGPSDALLKWPFNQKVTLMLLDQDHREHVIDAFRPDVTSSSFQRPAADMNVASGCPLFCPLSKMASKDGYVRGDTLFIKAIVDLAGL